MTMKKIVTDNRFRDNNTAPTAEISDDYSIESDEENMNINPSTISLPSITQAWKQPIFNINLQAQTVFNTSNIKIAVDISIAYAGAIGNFVLTCTPVKNIKPAEKPL